MSTVIISQNTGIVNINLRGETAEISVDRSTESAEIRGNVSKWERYKQLSGEISDRLIKLGYVGRGYRMKDCGSFIRYKICPDCGTFYVERTNLCRDRFCPICNWRLSLKRYVKMHEVFDTIDRRYPRAVYTMITLTLKNCKKDYIDQALNRIGEAWHKITSSRKFQGLVAGYAKSIEITYNRQTHEFHPHIHSIIMWTGAEQNDYIIDRWLELINGYGDELAVHSAQEGHEIYTVESGETFGDSKLGAILEVFKYAIKNNDLQDMPLNEFKALLGSVLNRRLVSFGGIIKNVARELNAADLEEIDGEDQEITVCKKCGSVDLDTMIYQWSFGTSSYQRVL